MQTKLDIPNQRKKFYYARIYINNRITKQFWGKLWERREHIRKAKWIGKMRKELGLDGGENKPRLTQSNTQKSTELENTMP